jgi:hypothetical protein
MTSDEEIDLGRPIDHLFVPGIGRLELVPNWQERIQEEREEKKEELKTAEGDEDEGNDELDTESEGSKLSEKDEEGAAGVVGDVCQEREEEDELETYFQFPARLESFLSYSLVHPKRCMHKAERRKVSVCTRKRKNDA